MSGRRFAVVLAAAGLAAAALAVAERPVGAAAPLRPSVSAKSGGVLAFRWVEPQKRYELVRVDARTLEAIPGRALAAGKFGLPSWTFSPDRLRLAMAPQAGRDISPSSSLRIVDPAGMARVLELPLGDGRVSLLAWLEPDRVLAVQTRQPGQTELVTIAPSAKRVLARRELDGRVVGAGRTADALALLLAPEDRIGPTRLAVEYAGGDFRSVPLERVWAGDEQGQGDGDEAFKLRRPGFALDPERGRALVFAPGGDAVEVDLRTLAVSYHGLNEPKSALSRLARWLSPAAEAKLVDGPSRRAVWLGDGLVALTGADYASWKDRDGHWHEKAAPSGLALVDSHRWSVRTFDGGASNAVFSDGLLLATGSTWESGEKTRDAIGLSAYGLDGNRRFRVFDGEDIWVWQVFDGLAYVAAGTGPLRVVEIATGRVVGERGATMPWVLDGDGSPFVG